MNLQLATLLSIAPLLESPVAELQPDDPQHAIVHEARVATEGLHLQGPIAVPRFDPAAGTLERVEVEVALEIDGLVALENTSLRLAFVKLDLLARLNALVPGRGPTLSTIDSDAELVLDRFDGARDFDGSSGRVLPAEIGVHATYVIDEGLDAYELDGSDTSVAVPVALRGALRVSGALECAMRAAWHAEVVVRVRYVYAEG